jgi:hypothetical protein
VRISRPALVEMMYGRSVKNFDGGSVAGGIRLISRCVDSSRRSWWVDEGISGISPLRLLDPGSKCGQITDELKQEHTSRADASNTFIEGLRMPDFLLVLGTWVVPPMVWLLLTAGPRDECEAAVLTPLPCDECEAEAVQVGVYVVQVKSRESRDLTNKKLTSRTAACSKAASSGK